MLQDYAERILDLTVEGNTKVCDYGAKKIVPNGKPHVSTRRIYLVMI